MNRKRAGNGLCVRGSNYNALNNYMDDMTGRFERILGNFFDKDVNLVSQMLSSSSFPKVNIYTDNETGDYHFEASLPGRTKNDIEISLENGYLTIEGKSIANKVDKEKTIYYYREIVKSSFKRTFGEFSPDIYDNDNIRAKMEDGILYIHLPKLQEAKRREEKRVLEIE
jgi:HSP20 family protein